MYIMNMDKCANPVTASVVCDQDLQRGLVVKIVGQANNNIWVDGADNEAYKVELADANADKGDLLIHTSVAFSYDERDTERDYVLKAGEVGRGHYLHTGDEYTLPADMVDADAVGEEVGLKGNGKLGTGATVVIGVVTKIYNFNGQESVRIRIK